MRHLAIFIHDFSATGVVRNALAIAAHMAAREGWRVTLVTARAEGVLLAAAEASGAGIVALIAADAPKSSRRADMIRCILLLRAWLNQARPDGLLSAGNHGHRTVWAATRFMGTPRRIYRISNDLKRRDGGASLKARLRQAVHWGLNRDAWRVALVSPRLAQGGVYGRAVRTGRARIIRNGVDIARVRELAAAALDHPAFSGDMPVVLGVGRLVKQKNFGALIAAVARARQVRPIRLVLLGDGDAEARAALRARGDALGLGDALVLIPGCDNPFAYMARADVVALSSVWEGAPNVLLEAMACNTPVVAARSAGNAAEILDQGRFGALADPDDPQAFAQALLDQADPGRRVLPGDRAQAFSLETTLAAYEEMFDALPFQQTARGATHRAVKGFIRGIWPRGA
jgi:glycosyltransferase involved in cell wall biosynthesis